MIKTDATEFSAELKAAYLKVIEDRAGLRVSEQQAGKLPRAVEAALRENNERDPWRLLRLLESGRDHSLLDSLASALRVGETHFFRVKPQIDALNNLVLPALVALRAKERRLNIWSAGCSSGEEPYTLAILLRESLPALADWQIHLVATDISESALQSAREGLYGNWSFRGTPPELRDRYFKAEGKRWRLRESIRQMVKFAPLNLINDEYPKPPFASAFDLILCRNVTIYFGPETTQRVYARLLERLAPSGWLILGPSDPVPDDRLGFETVPAPHALLWRRRDPTLQRNGNAPHAGGGGAPAAVLRTHSRELLPPKTTPTQSAQPHRPLPPLVVGRQRRAPNEEHHTESWGNDGAEAVDRAALERLVAREPIAVEAHLRLGVLYLEEREHDLAVQSLRRATFLDPHNPFAQFILGRAYLQAGEHPLAGRALSHALRLLQNQADDASVSGTELRVGDLRHAIEGELAARPATSASRRRS